MIGRTMKAALSTANCCCSFKDPCFQQFPSLLTALLLGPLMAPNNSMQIAAMQLAITY